LEWLSQYGVRNFLIKKLKTKYIDSSASDAVNHDTDDDMLPKIGIHIPYLGNRTWGFSFKIMSQ
jgi:hypothetical protein